MVRRIVAVCLAGLALVVTLGCGDSPGGKSTARNGNAAGPMGGPLFATAAPAKGSAPAAAPAEVITIDGCRIVVIDKQDVPSQRDGVVLKFEVSEGDVVQKDQLLAELDARLAEADVKIKGAKHASSIAEEDASVKTREESKARYYTQLDLWKKRATSEEDVRAAKLTWDRYISEAKSKGEAIELAKQELEQSRVVRDMHNIRSTNPGVVKVIYKKPGEAVKNLETVIQIYNIARLRVEGLVDEQYRNQLVKGMKVVVEPTLTDAPQQTFAGHLQEITGVAVSTDVDYGKGGKGPLVVSAGEDRMVCLWRPGQKVPVAILNHDKSVRSVACTGPKAAKNLCLTGTADGKGWLWELPAKTSHPKPLRELKESHRGAITCVAFTPDGKSCATGGEDREIRLWDAGTGELRYKLPAGHRGAITALSFTPQGLLVSAGCDNTLRVWEVHAEGAKQVNEVPRRSGDVTAPGVSPDGSHMLFDQGKSLQFLSVPDGRPEGMLKNPSGGANFTTFAQFSPDGQLVLTAGASEGQMQLWRAPHEGGRGNELRQFVPDDRSAATCAAFAPGGSFAVTGSKDRRVHLWRLPSEKEYAGAPLLGEIKFVEPAVETAGRQVRVWAELENPMVDGKPLLLPGGTATLVIETGKK